MRSDEYASYTGPNLIPQKSGYMLASTAALRLVPGAKPQPLHRASQTDVDPLAKSLTLRLCGCLQDQIAYQTRPDASNPLFTPMVGCLIAGSKCTKKNGVRASRSGLSIGAN